MITSQSPEEQLFYLADEIARPAAENFYLRLQAAVPDWERLAAPFRGAFSEQMGRPTDPVVYLKIFLVGYLENITYDTDLAERIADSIALRRFLGYSLSESPPEHSSISRNRALIGQHCQVEEILSRVVQVCIEKGLVDGERTAVDSSLVPANASLSSLRSLKTGKGVREHFREVRERNQLAEEGQPKEKLKVSNEEFRSTTDPDARIAKKPGTPKDMCYKATHLTDSKQGIILAAGCERADVGEVEAAQPVVEEGQRNLAAGGMALEEVVADAGYDAGEFHAGVEQLGATPITNYKEDSTKKPAEFKKAAFIYCREADCYLCPAGCLVRRQRQEGDRVRYVTEAADCAACPHREQCVGDKPVRYIYRQQHEDSRERNLQRCHREEGRLALRARKHIVEPPFGHMKTYGGLGLIACRGLDKARVKVVLAAVAWNLIKLVRMSTRLRATATAAVVSVTLALLSALRRLLRMPWAAPGRPQSFLRSRWLAVSHS